MKRQPLTAPTPWIIFGVGLAAVAVAQLVGWCANALGAQGSLVALPFAQAIIVGALMLHKHLGLPEIKWGCCFGRGLIMGFLAWIISTVLTLGLSWAFDNFLHIVAQEQSAVTFLRAAGPAEFSFMVLAAGIWAPFCEELYFRGWWLSWAQQRFSKTTSVVAIALIFAILHGDWVLVPGLFVAAVFFGITAVRWGLNSAIVAHVSFNLLTIFAARGGWL